MNRARFKSLDHEWAIEQFYLDLEKKKPDTWWLSKVTKRLYVGPDPYQRIDTLVEQGVGSILSLEQTLPPSIRIQGMPTKHVPIKDGTVFDPQQSIDALIALHTLLQDNEGPAYVHCYGGMNRSPNLAFLYLCSLGIKPESAALALKKSSPYFDVPNAFSLPVIESCQRFGQNAYGHFDLSVLDLQSK